MPLDQPGRAALLAAVVGGLILGRLSSKSNVLLRIKLKWLSLVAGGYILRNVKIPSSLLEDDADDADAEGAPAVRRRPGARRASHAAARESEPSWMPRSSSRKVMAAA